TSFSMALMIGREANSADAAAQAARASSIQHRPPWCTSASTNRWSRRSCAASSSTSVQPRSKNSQRTSCIDGLISDLAGGRLRPVQGFAIDTRRAQNKFPRSNDPKTPRMEDLHDGASQPAYHDNICARLRSLRSRLDQGQSTRSHYRFGEWWEVSKRRRAFRRSAKCTALERMGCRFLAASFPAVDY